MLGIANFTVSRFVQIPQSAEEGGHNIRIWAVIQARRTNGSNFPYRVCNQALSQLAPTGITSPPAPPVSSTMGVNFSTGLSQVCKQLDDLVPQTISENPGRQCLQWGCTRGRPSLVPGMATHFT